MTRKTWQKWPLYEYVAKMVLLAGNNYSEDQKDIQKINYGKIAYTSIKGGFKTVSP